jgi:hypothetical protein
VSVIFGLAFATFLTLILVPVMYDLLLQLRERRRRRRRGAHVSKPESLESAAAE